MKNKIITVFYSLIAPAVHAADTSSMLQSAAKGELPVEELEKSMTAGNVIAWILFGAVGFVFFMYGKKMSNMKLMLTAALIMGYPYIVHNTVLLYLIGIGLSALAWFLRKQ